MGRGTPEPPFTQAVDKAFLSVFLLSGDMSEAEDAVTDAILSLDLEDLDTDAFLICALTLAIQRNNVDSEHLRQREWCSLKLPVELEHVSLLSSALRRCFVLRILLGLSRDTCLKLLDIEEADMNVAICESVCLLALMNERTRPEQNEALPFFQRRNGHK